HDKLTNFNGYTPHDFDNGGMGDIKASTAILYSRNIPAVQVGQMEGMNNVIDLAHAMGIKSKLEPYLSTAIGASVVTLYEHVQGYQTFANNGQRVDLRVINEVQDSSGHTVFKYENPSSTTVLTPAEAFLMTDVLKNYQNTWRFGWNRQMASKTGTSDNGKGGIPDSWIMAYNPDIVAGVWIGNTAPDGGGGLIRAYGENVGLTTTVAVRQPGASGGPAAISELMLAMRSPETPFLDSVERLGPGSSLRAYVTRTLPHSSTIVVANRAPHEPRSEGGFTRGAGGVITALLTLAEVAAADWVACARTDGERALIDEHGTTWKAPLLRSETRLHY